MQNLPQEEQRGVRVESRLTTIFTLQTVGCDGPARHMRSTLRATETNKKRSTFWAALFCSDTASMYALLVQKTKYRIVH